VDIPRPSWGWGVGFGAAMVVAVVMRVEGDILVVGGLVRGEVR